MSNIRTSDGARDTVALLEALTRNDVVAAQTVLDHCDPGPTIFCLASAWITLAEYARFDTADLLVQMRHGMANEGGR